MTKIDFAEHGRVYLRMDIKPQDDTLMSPVRFKVDTGADNTTISKANLIKLGYDMEWIAKNTITYEDEDKPVTASGDRVNAGYVQLPLINLLGYEGKHWPFQIILDENHDFRNLLGRDLLTGFNFTFNNDDDVFTIDRAKAFKPRYVFLPDQEFHEIAAE